MRRALEMVLLALVIGGLGGCALLALVRQQQASLMEQRLAAAGFQKLVADTPEKMTRLDALQPYTLGSTVRHGKTTWYYADPNCRCAYVGGDAVHGRYQANERAGADERANPPTTWADSPESMEATQDLLSPENPELYGAPEDW
jgi:hypothetical protein